MQWYAYSARFRERPGERAARSEVARVERVVVRGDRVTRRVTVPPQHGVADEDVDPARHEYLAPVSTTSRVAGPSRVAASATGGGDGGDEHDGEQPLHRAATR